MNIQDLYSRDLIILTALCGSRSFGLASEKSDYDIHGVYVLPLKDRFKENPTFCINSDNNNDQYWEISQFLIMLKKASPNALELLFSPENCIYNKNEAILKLIPKKSFLTMRCYDSFTNFAEKQIKKAFSLNKKIFNPMPKEPKTILDFCFISEGVKSIPLKEYLSSNNMSQDRCAIASINNMTNLYALYYDDSKSSENRWGFGIVNNERESKDIHLQSIPKNLNSICNMYFNRDSFSNHLKKHFEYWNWVKERNEDRYSTTINHGKGYDSKNMLHVFRTYLTLKDIALYGDMIVDRSKDRTFLLNIKKGAYEYEELLEMQERLKEEIKNLFLVSGLPAECPDIYEILYEVITQSKKE